MNNLLPEPPAALVPVKHVSFMKGTRIMLFGLNDRALVAASELAIVMGTTHDAVQRFIQRNSELFADYIVDVENAELAVTVTANSTSRGRPSRLFVDRRGALMVLTQMKSKLHPPAVP